MKHTLTEVVRILTGNRKEKPKFSTSCCSSNSGNNSSNSMIKES